MAKDDKPKDLIGYAALQQDALRSVVRGALQCAGTPHGLPGDHHFYISFRTDFPDVIVPEELVGRYPEEMTIVLQNQFWDLSPGPESFSVTLQFSGQPKSLSIPYAALTRFYDPSVQYLLQFTPTAAPVRQAPERQAEPPRDEGPKVVSLDQFRKK
ncbi:MAG: SspB family protein [Caulobacteraceae bacterium]